MKTAPKRDNLRRRRKMHIADRRALYTFCGRAAYMVEWTTPTSAAVEHEKPAGRILQTVFGKTFPRIALHY